MEDLHTHTIVSDGEFYPEELIKLASSSGVKKLSITDHDSIGAYKLFPQVFDLAKKLNVELITGCEFDADYKGVEVHILGYNLDITNKDLNEYLSQIQEKRREKLLLQIEKINEYFKREVLVKDEIFIKERETFMKPHIVRPIIKLMNFNDYPSAAKWVREVAHVDVKVPKMSSSFIIDLIKMCDGIPVLAHPGYYIVESGFKVDRLIKDFVDMGIEGIEVEYRYHGTSKYFRRKKDELDMIKKLHEEAVKYKLLETRGSDAHVKDDFLTFNSRSYLWDFIENLKTY